MVPVPLAIIQAFGEPSGVGIFSTRGQSELDIMRRCAFQMWGYFRLLPGICFVSLATEGNEGISSIHPTGAGENQKSNQPKDRTRHHEFLFRSLGVIHFFCLHEDFQRVWWVCVCVFPVSFNVFSTMGFITMRLNTHFNFGGNIFGAFFSNHWTSNTSTNPSQRRRVVRWLL